QRGRNPSGIRQTQRKNFTAFFKVIHTPQPMGIHTANQAAGTTHALPASNPPGALAVAVFPERVCSEVASSCSAVIWYLAGVGLISQLQMKPSTRSAARMYIVML